MVYKESRGPTHQYIEKDGEDTENKRPRTTKEIKQTRRNTDGLGVASVGA
jgi:hypothetical protein